MIEEIIGESQEQQDEATPEEVTENLGTTDDEQSENPDDAEIAEADTIVGQLRASHTQYKRITSKDVQLRWLLDDFEGIAVSVYEAVMASSQRARQIARRQKLEIDMYNANMQLDEIEGLEEIRDPGIDLFQHPKPIVQALFELKRKRFKFNYGEEKPE